LKSCVRAKINPAGLVSCDHACVLMREIVVHTKRTIIGTRFERDAIKAGDSGDRCPGEKKGSRRSSQRMVRCDAREPGTKTRR